jgi:hypothetical protein
MVHPLQFLGDGGQVGALMRAQDWSDSPLGPPQTGRTRCASVVALLLQSRFPMFVAWGPSSASSTTIPYAEILGAKHPRALGRRFHDIWSEIWTTSARSSTRRWPVRPATAKTFRCVMNRKGYDEQTWFTFSYSPGARRKRRDRGHVLRRVGGRPRRCWRSARCGRATRPWNGG